MPLRRNQIIMIGGGLLLAAFFGILIYFGALPPRIQGNAKLVFWSPIDNQQVFKSVLDEFDKASKGHIQIEFVSKNIDTYEKDLINALAAGQGPDVFLMPNTWLAKHYDKIQPMPTTNEFMNLRQFQDNYVDVAVSDLIRDNQIYALPLYVDSLALFYNKDIMGRAGIVKPPATWDEFKDAARKMTQIDALGNITQSGAAMGTWSDRYKNGNINRAPDILYLLMLQTGTQMVDVQDLTVNFDKPRQTAAGESIYPGLEALNFYTGFANPASVYYSWNPQLHYSIDAFSEGTLGMMLNYNYTISTVRAKNPNLNFGVAPAPQAQQTTLNFANYFALAVSIQSSGSDEAWRFAQYITSPDHVWLYLNDTGRPSAARRWITEQAKVPELGVFAEQALTSRSWYQTDPSAIESIFNSMIESIVVGRATADAAIRQAAADVQLLMPEKNAGPQ